MSDIADMTIKSFLDDLASSSPAPGGGAVAAIGAAMAASLVVMVAELTVNKKGFESHQDRMSEIIILGKKLKDRSTELIDLDVLAFNKVMVAFKLPKDQQDKKEKIQFALKEAANVPLEVMNVCDEIIKLAEEVGLNGNKNAYSDARSAKYFADAAKSSAKENVLINMSQITDEVWKKNVNERM